MINSTFISNLKKSFEEEAPSEKELLFKSYIPFDNLSFRNEKRKEFGKVVQFEKKVKSIVLKSLKMFISFEESCDERGVNVEDLEIERILNKKRQTEKEK